MLAGVLLLVFGAAGTWLIYTRFPQAKLLTVGYAFMTAAGGFFIAWALSKFIAAGIAGVALLAVGGVMGIAGALRRELRPPQ